MLEHPPSHGASEQGPAPGTGWTSSDPPAPGLWGLYLLLLLLTVVVAHHRLGPGPAARPPPAALEPVLGLLLPAKLDLHFDRASWGGDQEERRCELGRAWHLGARGVREPCGLRALSGGCDPIPSSLHPEDGLQPRPSAPPPPPARPHSHSDSEPSSSPSSSSSLSSPSLSSSFSIFCRTLVKTDCRTMESS